MLKMFSYPELPLDLLILDLSFFENTVASDQLASEEAILSGSTLFSTLINSTYSKTCVKQPLSKRHKIVFQDQLSLNAGQKYCRMLQGEHSAIILTFIKPPFVLRSLFCQFLSGNFTHVLLYLQPECCRST